MFYRTYEIEVHKYWKCKTLSDKMLKIGTNPDIFSIVLNIIGIVIISINHY